MTPTEYWRGVAEHAATEFDDSLIERMVQHEIGFWNTPSTRGCLSGSRRCARTATPASGFCPTCTHPIAGESAARLRGSWNISITSRFSFDGCGFLQAAELGFMSILFRGWEWLRRAALFIDDKQENVDGARAVGMRAELFTLWEEFVADVPKRYGLPGVRASRNSRSLPPVAARMAW